MVYNITSKKKMNYHGFSILDHVHLRTSLLTIAGTCSG